MSSTTCHAVFRDTERRRIQEAGAFERAQARAADHGLTVVDRSGFPLEIQSFEGNRAEVKTIVPVPAGFKERHGLSGITVTADSAMLSAGNIEVLERLGYHYIIGLKLAKTPVGRRRFRGRPDLRVGARPSQSTASTQNAEKFSSIAENGPRSTYRTSTKRWRRRRRLSTRRQTSSGTGS